MRHTRGEHRQCAEQEDVGILNRVTGGGNLFEEVWEVADDFVAECGQWFCEDFRRFRCFCNFRSVMGCGFCGMCGDCGFAGSDDRDSCFFGFLEECFDCYACAVGL